MQFVTDTQEPKEAMRQCLISTLLHNILRKFAKNLHIKEILKTNKENRLISNIQGLMCNVKEIVGYKMPGLTHLMQLSPCLSRVLNIAFSSFL